MTPLIQLQNITVVRSGQTILKDVSLKLMAKERLALIGHNGAGKTTLLRTIVGLQPVSTGSITAFGLPQRTERDFQKSRLRIGYLFQDPDDQLFCPTVLEDVAFGPLNCGLGKQSALRKAVNTLGLLDLAHLADRITHRLSGGEKRLVSLAAILAMDPSVLLLDEPTNALDEQHLQHLTDFLMHYDAAMIIVSHDRNFIETIASGAVLLDNKTVTSAVIHKHPHVHDHVHFHEPGAELEHNTHDQHRSATTKA